MEVHVARQPIYDRQLQVYGYELLYRRSAGATTADVIDDDAATATVLMNTFTEIGLKTLTAGRPAFINLSRRFLGEQDLALPKEGVVLELLENIEPDAEMIDAVRRLSRAGYRIALDDFVLGSDQRDRLLPYVDIVKVDVFDMPPQQIVHHARILRRHRVACLLAEKIETQEIMKLCRSSGFDYFQGFFLSRPSTMSKRTVSSGRLPLLRLIAAMQDPEIQIHQLEQLVNQDPSLSYKLLRYLASPIFPARGIDSIRSAILYLGQRGLANWATLMALSASHDQPSERIVALLMRAQLCQQLAADRRHVGPAARLAHDPSTAFTVGLFSGLDAVLDAPLAVICDELPLTPATREALLERRGPYGAVLACALAQEQGHWEAIAELGFVASRVADHYVAALRWADAHWAWLARIAETPNDGRGA